MSECRIEIDARTCDLTMAQVMDLIRERKAANPDREYWLDGDAYAIVSAKRGERMDYSAIGKRWEPNTGQARYYVNDWKDLIGLHVEYYKTGNVCEVWMDGGETISNSHYKKYLENTKVWIGEDDGQVHVDHCGNDSIKGIIIARVNELIEKKAKPEPQKHKCGDCAYYEGRGCPLKDMVCSWDEVYCEKFVTVSEVSE